MDQNPTNVRGTANKGIGTDSAPERNVPLGNVVELVPKRLYNVIGFDIAKADVSKPGIREGLEPIVQQLVRSDDVRPSVVITGHASESRFPGKGPEHYEQARAEALKKYLVSRGVNPSSIRTETSGSGGLPSGAYSAEQKAAARAATVEITSSGEKRLASPEQRGTGDSDGVTYFKGPPSRWPTLPSLPDFGPLRRPGFEFGGNESPPEQHKSPRTDPTVWPQLKQNLRTVGHAALGIMALAYFLPEFLTALVLEYGEEKAVEYLKQVKKGLNKPRDDKHFRQKFMNQMRTRILASGEKHPLYFLINPQTKDWKARRVYTRLPAVNAGHTLSYQGQGYAYALEDPVFNIIFRSGKIEAPGGFAWSRAIKIGEVPVDLRTARSWEIQGLLAEGTCDKAKSTVGWLPF